MHIKKLSIINFKNYSEAAIDFDEGVNAFVGGNGEGKTNLLDAIHYLSLCKSYFNTIDGQNIKQNEDFFILQGSFELDKLEEWKLKNELLHLDDDDAIEAYRVKALKTGALPLKHMADIQISNTLEEVAPVKKILLQCVGDLIESELVIDIPLEGSVITGKLNGIYNDKILVVSFSKNHYKYLLEAFIKYVLATAQGLTLELNYLSAEKKSIFTIPKNTYTQAKALEVLIQLL